MPEIRLVNLTKQFSFQGQTRAVLSGISMDINPGNFILISGSSGSGKTTLLMTLGGLITPDTGTRYFHDPRSGKKDGPLTLKEVSYIFQNNFLLSDYTALENILFPFQIHQKITKDLTKKACFLMEEFGILKLASKKIGSLSGGEQQAIGFIRGVLAGSPLILADEPTSDMDQRMAEKAFRILKNLNHAHETTIVLISHNPESMKYAKEFYLMENGKFLEYRKLSA